MLSHTVRGLKANSLLFRGWNYLPHFLLGVESCGMVRHSLRVQWLSNTETLSPLWLFLALKWQVRECFSFFLFFSLVNRNEFLLNWHFLLVRENPKVISSITDFFPLTQFKVSSGSQVWHIEPIPDVEETIWDTPGTRLTQTIIFAHIHAYKLMKAESGRLFDQWTRTQGTHICEAAVLTTAFHISIKLNENKFLSLQIKEMFSILSGFSLKKVLSSYGPILVKITGIAEWIGSHYQMCATVIGYVASFDVDNNNSIPKLLWRMILAQFC